MSTYWYLECTDHDPPIRSADEVEQHTYGLDPIRELVRRRAEIADDAFPDYPRDYDYFARHAVTFLVQHPKCSMRLVSEYGDTEEVE
jgi:hypothetical protein